MDFLSDDDLRKSISTLDIDNDVSVTNINWKHDWS